jgi:hypothetical protein
MFYNPKRKHARNGMLSPVEFEKQQKTQPESVYETRATPSSTNTHDIFRRHPNRSCRIGAANHPPGLDHPLAACVPQGKKRWMGNVDCSFDTDPAHSIIRLPLGALEKWELGK